MWNKVVNFCKSVANKVSAKLAAMGSAVSLAAANAQAELPAAVDTAMTTVQTDGVAMVTKGFALVAAVTGLMIILGLFKKVLKKGASA